ncbi:hypothetical protein N9917_04875 [Deltaproteobacteria bacterium]|nr:hypothetical protein [Deltaproteobacteria bacterium]
MELTDWIANHQPRPEMYWKGAALRQFQGFTLLAEQLGCKAQVVGEHTSKSIKLPVMEITGTHGRFLLRDNFYGTNVCFQWEFSPDIPLSDLYKPMTWDDYLALILKKRESGMGYGYWTDEEMADPRILRVEVKRDNGNSYWSKVSPEAKDRWMARMTSTEWFSRDWSSGKLIVVGDMGPGCTMYAAPHSFAEGISRIVHGDALEPWEPGKTEGIFDMGDANAALGLMKLINSAQPSS